MARQDNPFALLGEDDDGSDVTVLIAKVEAKISTTAAPPAPEQQKPKAGVDGFHSKPLPPSEYVRTERGRGRGGRGRGLGRAVFRSRGGGAGDEADGQFGNGASRAFDGDSNGRSRGRGGGRGGRGRGRGRGFYEERGFGNENQNNGGNENQGQGGDGLEERGEVQGKYYGSGENRPPRYENGKFGEEGRNSDWEEKGYSGDGRGFRGGERRGGRGYTGRGFRGGEGRRYGGRDGTRNLSENKEAPADGTEQAVNDAPSGDGATGWDMPATNDVSKDAEPEQVNPEKVVSEDASEKKMPEEEDNSMTLDEYEKLLQEKRKALEALRTVERRVVVDKEFEGMQLVEKKKDDELKLKVEKDKLKKKDNVEKEEKVRKSVSINEFLKPVEGERYVGPASARGRGGGRGRGRGERGGFRGGYGGRGRVAPAPSIEDPGQFPILGAVAKA
ncbi:RGG repeats nuclear RNA binding protein A-like [Phoenix dactylifera]|uniref:RGG repeats nuclear RNA binding protein A-like n=1 Tax=Phoenix dactylifera TaxID=42345 RepID=A0A8B7C705_PHODC|nr:RGG repeats nuclear RNA binding protein A-like [Phoenix dactylifera]